MLKLLNIPYDEEKLSNEGYPDALSMIEEKPDSLQEEKFDKEKALAEFEEFVKILQTKCEEIMRKSKEIARIETELEKKKRSVEAIQRSRWYEPETIKNHAFQQIWYLDYRRARWSWHHLSL